MKTPKIAQTVQVRLQGQLLSALDRFCGVLQVSRSSAVFNLLTFFQLPILKSSPTSTESALDYFNERLSTYALNLSSDSSAIRRPFEPHVEDVNARVRIPVGFPFSESAARSEQLKHYLSAILLAAGQPTLLATRLVVAAERLEMELAVYLASLFGVQFKTSSTHEKIKKHSINSFFLSAKKSI